MTGLLSVAGSTPSEGFELKSCRFDGVQSTKLSKTFSTTGNPKTWTISLWTKRTELTTRNGYFMSLSAGGQPRGGVYWAATGEVNPNGILMPGNHGSLCDEHFILLVLQSRR